jgi:hypothetical protein
VIARARSTRWLDINGQGLCKACNYAKEAPGWHSQRLAEPGHVVETVTPTGHRHRSRSPDPPGRRRYTYRLEIQFPRAA